MTLGQNVTTELRDVVQSTCGSVQMVLDGEPDEGLKHG